MKTKEILDKYSKLIAGLLKVEPKEISFFLSKYPFGASVDFKYASQAATKITGITQVYDENKKMGLNDWSEGNYAVFYGEKLVSMFELYRMPHCCAILISCKSHVAIQFRGKRIASTLNMLRQEIGRALGYSLLLCTDIDTNEHQRKLLATNGWKDVHDVINKRTKNRVYISVINL